MTLADDGGVCPNCLEDYLFCTCDEDGPAYEEEGWALPPAADLDDDEDTSDE